MTPLITAPQTIPDGWTELEWIAFINGLSRRDFISGALATALLAACGDNERPSTVTDSPGWSFVDDLGRTIQLTKAPERIASVDDVVSTALIKAGLNVVASPLLPGGLFDDLQIPRESVTSISAEGGKFDVEKLAAIAPDVIVDFTDAGAPAVTTLYPAMQDVAPVVALQFNDATIEKIIESARRFSQAALGHQVEDMPDKEAYTAALKDLSTTLAAKPGLRIGFFGMLANTDNLFLLRARNTPAMQTLAAVGAHFVPDTAPATEFFQTVSWERAPKLPMDVLILGRGGSSDIGTPSAIWDRIPAVAAGQVYTADPLRWLAFFYSNFAPLLADLATFLSSAEIVGPQ